MKRLLLSLAIACVMFAGSAMAQSAKFTAAYKDTDDGTFVRSEACSSTIADLCEDLGVDDNDENENEETVNDSEDDEKSLLMETDDTPTDDGAPPPLFFQRKREREQNENENNRATNENSNHNRKNKNDRNRNRNGNSNRRNNRNRDRFNDHNNENENENSDNENENENEHENERGIEVYEKRDSKDYRIYWKDVECIKKCLLRNKFNSNSQSKILDSLLLKPCIDEEEDMYLPSWIDVTTVLRYMIRDGELNLSSGTKISLPGFYDCSPQNYSNKQLFIVYKHNGNIYYCNNMDVLPLSLPNSLDLEWIDCNI